MDEVGPIIEMLESDDESLRGRGACEARKLRDRRLIPKLVKLAVSDCSERKIGFGMVDEYTTVCREATAALDATFEAHGFSDDDERLLREAAVEPSADDECAGWLLHVMGTRVRAIVEGLAVSESPRLRRRALLATSETGAGSFLDDPDVEVRLAAYGRLPWPLPAELRAALARSMSDAEPRIRALGARRLGEECIEGPLLDALSSERHTDVRLEIARGLGRMRGDGVTAALVSLLDDESPLIRAAAAAALERVDGRGVARAVFERLRRESDDSVRAALLSHRHFRDHVPEALSFFVDLLLKAETDGDTFRAAYALERFGAGVIGPLLAALPRMRDSARRHARSLLQRHGHREEPPPEGGREGQDAFIDELRARLERATPARRIAFAADLAARHLEAASDLLGAEALELVEEIRAIGAGRAVLPGELDRFDAEITRLATLVDPDRVRANDAYRGLRLLRRAARCSVEGGDVEPALATAVAALEAASAAVQEEIEWQRGWWSLTDAGNT